MKFGSLFTGIGGFDLGFDRAGMECALQVEQDPDGWTEGQADTQRYKQLGNAVGVPVAQWIGRRLMQHWVQELEKHIGECK